VLSQLVLQLHGILTGNIAIDRLNSDEVDSQLEKMENALSKEKIKDSETDSKLLKLKLILPGEKGDSREIDIGQIDISGIKGNSNSGISVRTGVEI
jgi:hypothetical protein